MKAYELRGKTREELINDLNNLNKELFNLRMRHTYQGLPNPLRLRTIKRDIARIKTILHEAELGKIELLQPKTPQRELKGKKG